MRSTTGSSCGRRRSLRLSLINCLCKSSIARQWRYCAIAWHPAPVTLPMPQLTYYQRNKQQLSPSPRRNNVKTLDTTHLRITDEAGGEELLSRREITTGSPLLPPAPLLPTAPHPPSPCFCIFQTAALFLYPLGLACLLVALVTLWKRPRWAAALIALADCPASGK